MAKRRPGLPEDHDLKVELGGLDEVADIPDFLDMEVGSAALAQRVPESTAPREKLRVIPATPPAPQPAASAAGAVAPARATPPPPAAPKPAIQKPQAAPAPARARPRTRPPRKEVGFDDETLAMLKDLHGDGSSQSMEESLTRSEVARAALRAIHAARNLVDYSRIGPRGKWGSPTARALVDDLTDAYVRAVGEFFNDRYQPDAGGGTR